MMFTIGAHLSSSGGFMAMLQTAQHIGANTFQFFTRNPRGGAAKPINVKDAQDFMAYMDTHAFGPILAHAPYTLNFCAADPAIRQFAIRTLADDLYRMEFTPHQYYNLHPGSHVQQGSDVGIALIADALNEAMKQAAVAQDQDSRLTHKAPTTLILLETMAGKGTEVGRSFEELRAIIDRTEQPQRIGVCLDTCHVHDAGYDIVHELDAVLAHFDKIVGLDRLKAIHINDSKNPLESHKDRHQTIGGGFLGLNTFRRVINHPLLRDLPFYLETPNELPGYALEIDLLKKERTGA